MTLNLLEDLYKNILFFILNKLAAYDAAIAWFPALTVVIPRFNVNFYKGVGHLN